MNLRKQESITGILFAAPSIIGFLLFFAVPFGISFVYCFTSGVGDLEFVGLQNFIDLFNNAAFQLAVKNTLLFNILSVPLLMVLSLTVSIILNSNMKKASFFRTALTMPFVVPVASVVLVWQTVWGQNGVINNMLKLFGITGPNYLQTRWAFLILLLLYVWKNCGYNMIIFIAGLNNIPKEYYEAAEIDGCSNTKIFFVITLPLLAPTLFFVFIISIINSLKVYREAYLLAGQIPDPSIYMLQHFMNNNFSNLNYQRLSTAAFIVFVLVAGLIYILYRVQHKYENN